MSELARRYAQALWQVSPDGEALERTARALMEEPALWEALCSPAVQAGEKGRVLARLPGLEEGGPLPHFYRLLAEKGRMALLPEIVEAFHALELARRGGARCMLTCVRPLEAEELRSSGRPCAVSTTRRRSSLTCAPTRPCWAALPWISRAYAMTRASAGRWAGWAANWKRGEWHESKTGRDCLRPAGGDSEL